MAPPSLPDPRRIERLLALYGPPLGPEVAVQVQRYLQLLLEWNRHMNLTAIREPEEMVGTLFGETFFAAGLLVEEAGPLLDVGSGAGFPGLALKLIRPRLDCYLVEPRQKRAAFLSTVRRELRLEGVRVLSQPLQQCRAGDFAPPPQLLTLRAVGRTEFMILRGLQLLSPPAGVLLFTTRRLLEGGFPAQSRIDWGRPIPVPGSRQKVLLWGQEGSAGTHVPRET